MKVQVINKSKFSQRISFLPPTTPFFKIKYSRRGLIPAGLNETIYISFIPQAYQYYYDYIRVICEGEKMIIPIHAFPKMNVHIKDYIPKFIDFGTVPINNGDHKEIILRNIITLPFEFEFVPIKTCEEIKVEPIVGEVEALYNKVVTIKFFPQSYGLFVAEYEFRLSEYEYQPMIISISGSCNVFDKVISDNIIKRMKTLKDKDTTTLDLVINKKNFKHKDLHETTIKKINNLNESNLATESFAKLVEDDEKDKLNFKTLNISSSPAKKTDRTMNNSISAQLSPRGIAKKYKNFPSNKEREFLNYFNNIDTIIKEKDIKYFQFIGKKLLTEEESNRLLNERIRESDSMCLMKRKIDLNRFSTEVDIEKCVIDRKSEYMLKPTFNYNQNDKFFKTRHYFSTFLKIMTKVLINNRVDKRLNKIRKMISSNNIKTPKDFADFVDKDWASYAIKDNNTEESKMRLKFQTPKMMARPEVYLAYDYNIETLKQDVQHENNINLEELSEYEKLDKYDPEIIGYKGNLFE